MGSFRFQNLKTRAIYRRTPKLAPKIAAFLEFARGAFAAFDPEELTLIHEKERFA